MTTRGYDAPILRKAALGFPRARIVSGDGCNHFGMGHVFPQEIIKIGKLAESIMSISRRAL